jgi:hypothetical protein
MRHHGSKAEQQSKDHGSKAEQQSKDLVDQLNRKLIEKAEAEIDYTRVLTLKAKTWWKEAAWFSTFVVLALGIFTASVQHDKALVLISKESNDLARQRNDLDKERMKDEKEKYGEFTKARQAFTDEMKALPGKIQVAVNAAVKPLQEQLAKAEQYNKAKDAEIAALKANQKAAPKVVAAAPQNSGKEPDKSPAKPPTKIAANPHWWNRIFRAHAG